MSTNGPLSVDRAATGETKRGRRNALMFPETTQSQLLVCADCIIECMVRDSQGIAILMKKPGAKYFHLEGNYKIRNFDLGLNLYIQAGFFQAPLKSLKYKKS